MKINPETYYVWIGGSCDYAHKERASAGACIVEHGGEAIETWTCSALGSTEFRMLQSGHGYRFRGPHIKS